MTAEEIREFVAGVLPRAPLCDFLLAEIAAQLAEINHHLSHGDYALEVRNVEP